MKQTKPLLMMAGMLLWANHTFAIDVKDGVYQISTAQDLVEFSTTVVAAGNGGASAVLTKDIDMTDVAFEPIGSMDNQYTGSFDGQCHYVRNLNIDTPEKDKVGLFGVVANGATISNLIVDANSSISGHAFVGGIIGSTDGGGSITLKNVGNEATVFAQDVNAAGLVGVSMNGACAINLINCFNTGMVSGSWDSASFCGWLGSGSVIENCYSYSTLASGKNGGSVYRNGATIKGVLYDNTGEQGQIIDDEELVSGAFAYQLNGKQSEAPIWFQNLSDDTFDEHPIPFSTHPTVYANGALNCDGTAKPGSELTYANTNKSNRDPHQFAEGICSVCGSLDKTYLTANSNGYYELENAAQLYWFAKLVNEGEVASNALLTADIDYTSKDLSIAENLSFKGTFDGQGHKVTINFNTDHDNTALFGFLDAASIKNLVVDGNIETSGKFAGGVYSVGYNSCLLTNVVSAVNIKCSAEGDVTMGGIASNSASSLRLTNVAFVGSIYAPNAEGSAGLIGYAHGGDEAVFTNCFVAANMNMAKGSYVNRKAVIMDNCYYIPMNSSFDNQDTEADSRATQLSDVTALTSGQLCYLLNQEDGGSKWFQTLATDAYPVPFATSKKVYLTGTLSCNGKPFSDTSYANEAGQVDKAAHDLNGNGECTVCGNRVISNGQQLLALQNDCKNAILSENVGVELANDIDMAGIDGYVGIGTRDVPFKGTFDGKGHVINNLIINVENDGNAGLFAFVAGGTTIKNLVVRGDIYAEKGWVGGIIGVVLNTGGLVNLENVGNEADVTTDGPNAAGIIGVAEGSLITMTNVYNAGMITGGKESAAISGWLSKNAMLTNVYNVGTITPSGVSNDDTFARYRESINVGNCYELATNSKLVNAVTEEQVKSGELCYLLNGSKDNGTNFYQTLGADEYPVLFATHKTVYKDGDTYKNDAGTGIEGVQSTPSVQHPAAIYTLSGIKIGQMQKGVNIVKMADGTVKKMIKK